MDKKTFERLAGYKVTEKYYRNALQARMYVGNYMTDEAFVKEWTEGADNSELVTNLIRWTEELNEMLIREKTNREKPDVFVEELLKEKREAEVELGKVLKERDRLNTDVKYLRSANDTLHKQLRERLDAEEETARQAARTVRADTEDAARWKAAAEGMKRRMQAMIETEIIKAGWRAVNYQPCALLLQLLREELPEFDPVTYLKELSLKYNH